MSNPQNNQQMNRLLKIIVCWTAKTKKNKNIQDYNLGTTFGCFELQLEHNRIS